MKCLIQQQLTDETIRLLPRATWQVQRGQIYCIGFFLKTIYETGSVSKLITTGSNIYVDSAIPTGGKHVSPLPSAIYLCTAIGKSGTKADSRLCRCSDWRDMLSHLVSPFVLAGHANVGSPAIGTCGTRRGCFLQRFSLKKKWVQACSVSV